MTNPFFLPPFWVLFFTLNTYHLILPNYNFVLHQPLPVISDTLLPPSPWWPLFYSLYEFDCFKCTCIWDYCGAFVLYAWLISLSKMFSRFTLDANNRISLLKLNNSPCMQYIFCTYLFTNGRLGCPHNLALIILQWTWEYRCFFNILMPRT